MRVKANLAIWAFLGVLLGLTNVSAANQMPAPTDEAAGFATTLRDFANNASLASL